MWQKVPCDALQEEGEKQAHEGFLQTSVFLLRTLHFSQVIDTGGNLSWKANRIPILYQAPLVAVEPYVEVLVNLWLTD